MPAAITTDHLRRALSRDLSGTSALVARAEATERPDLETILRFAARRRAARAGRHHEPAAPASSPHAGSAGAAAATPEARSPEPRTGGAPRLLRRIDVAATLLRLFVSRPSGFDYRPGQHVKMGLPGVLRTYSLASAPHEDHLEFFVEVFPGGRLSRRLQSATPGTAMALGDRAKGALAVDGRYVNQLLIATVTGIAPYVSFVRDHLHRTGSAGARRFVILHGASHADELGYDDELAELARRHPQTLTYVPTVSRPQSPRNAGWTGARGRVDAHVDALLTRFGLSPADTAAFACGNPDMVRNVADGLRRRGFVTHTEPFD